MTKRIKWIIVTLSVLVWVLAATSMYLYRQNRYIMTGIETIIQLDTEQLRSENEMLQSHLDSQEALNEQTLDSWESSNNEYTGVAKNEIYKLGVEIDKLTYENEGLKLKIEELEGKSRTGYTAP